MRVINVLKTKNIIKVSPDDTLSHALSTLSSSHDAAFVFTKKNELLGVINPYHSLIVNSYPANAKVEHCLFHPPKLSTNFSLSRVAQLMIESKVHYLPVFDERQRFTGIVSARNLLSHLKDSGLFHQKIGVFLKTKKGSLLTVLDNDSMSSAISLFKTHKVSKLVVISKEMKLRGILTYYDLINFLLTPKQKEGKGDRVGVRTSFTYQQVKNLAKTYVLTLSSREYLTDALTLILQKSIGSVVIVDNAKHPVGIITTRDFLNLVARGRTESKVEVVSKGLSESNMQILESFAGQITNFSKKLPDIRKVTLFVKEEKKGGVFETVLHMMPVKGAVKIIKRQGKNLRDLLLSLKKTKKG